VNNVIHASPVDKSAPIEEVNDDAGLTFIQVNDETDEEE